MSPLVNDYSLLNSDKNTSKTKWIIKLSHFNIKKQL